MKSEIVLLAFSTSNYDEMVKFFGDFGFAVTENPMDQLLPFFEQGRAARVSRGDLEFQLEESRSAGASACFNLFVVGFSEHELEQVKRLGYKFEYSEGPCGNFHMFRSPDGGRIVV